MTPDFDQVVEQNHAAIDEFVRVTTSRSSSSTRGATT